MDAAAHFPVVDGRFVEVTLPRGALAVDVEGSVRALRLPEGVSVYLRGGVAERVTPHPRADIDLVTVGPAAAHGLAEPLREALAREGRPVEVTHLTPEALGDDVVHRVLLSTRARLLAGPGVDVPPVLATDAVVWAFWTRYAAFLVAPRAGTPPIRRVCELKQLTRCFGAVRWFLDGVFTRDVAASLAFADRWAPAAARRLRAGWAEVEADGVSPVGRLNADAIRAPLVPFVQEMHALGRR